MPALEAARIGDQIAHSSAWEGLLIGAVAGVALAVAVVAIVGTGGVAAVAIGAGIASAGAGGALAGAHIGELLPTEPKGPILTGSPNTFAGSKTRNVARAGIDVVECADHNAKLLAVGSLTVFVNGWNFARKSEKTACDASIHEGCPKVMVGGESVLAPGMSIDEEIPPWVKTTLTVVMWGGAIIATGGAAAVVGWGAAIGGFSSALAGGAVFGWAGEAIGRRFGGELGARIGEVIGGTVGSMAGGMIGGLLGNRLYPRGYLRPSAKSNAVMDQVFTAMGKEGVGKGKTVGVVVDRDGIVTIAVSGNPPQTQKIYNRIKPHLPDDYHYASPSEVPLEKVQLPDGTQFRGGGACVEPKLSPALQKNPEGMTVRTWGEGPVKPGSPDRPPCLSCDLNRGRIGGPVPASPPPIFPAPAATNGGDEP